MITSDNGSIIITGSTAPGWKLQVVVACNTIRIWSASAIGINIVPMLGCPIYLGKCGSEWNNLPRSLSWRRGISAILETAWSFIQNFAEVVIYVFHHFWVALYPCLQLLVSESYIDIIDRAIWRIVLILYNNFWWLAVELKAKGHTSAYKQRGRPPPFRDVT